MSAQLSGRTQFCLEDCGWLGRPSTLYTKTGKILSAQELYLFDCYNYSLRTLARKKT